MLLYLEKLVGCPLDRADVDAILEHIPQRRQFTQFVYLGLHQFNREIDIGFGSETADGETDRAVRQFVATTKRAQYIRWFQRGRSTSGTRRYRQIFDRHDQRLALNVVEADVQVVRHTVLHVAVDVGFFDFLQAFGQTVAQRFDAGDFGVHFHFDQAEGFAHADDLVGRQRARTQAALVATAVHLRFDTHTWLAAHVQRAHAFRAIGFVRGEGHQVDLGFLQVDM